MCARFLFSVLSSLLLGGAVLAPASYAQEQFPSQRVGHIPTESLSPEVKRAAWTAVRGEDGAKKEGPMAKVGMELAVLYYQHEREGPPGVRSLQEARSQRLEEKKGNRRRGERRVRLPISSDGQFVTVEAVAAAAPKQLLEALRDLGLEKGATAGNLVSGHLPLSAIEDAARLSALRGMMPSYARVHVGSVESEADSAHRADEARTNAGVNGSGQKICALSDSYDNADVAITAADDVQSGDLPGAGNPEGNTTPVDVLDDFAGGGGNDPTDEGRAMLQLIHDIAPGAELGFHTAFRGLSDFANGIRELSDAGCTVIVDDVGFFVEPFYQDGPVSTAVNDVVNDDGAVYFSSAGNDGQNSYEAPFRGSGEDGLLNSSSELHDFDPSSTTDTRQNVTVEGGGTFQVISFQWTDPSAIVDGSDGADTDLDIALVDQSGSVVASSDRDNVTDGVPFETLEYTNNSGGQTALNLVIERAEGPDPDEIKYIYGGNGFQIDEFDTLGPTVFGHPTADGAMAVAAAPFFNTAAFNSNVDSAAVLDFFSSKGGIPILFDQNGDRLPSPVVRQKPEVTGTDFVDNTFFGNDIDVNDPDSDPNFPGTSAAAPNVAAIAALVKQSRPELPPTEVYERLEENSVDVQARQRLENGNLVGESIAAGVDPWSGFGFLRADRAVPPPRDVQIVNFEAEGSVSSGTDGPLVLNWRQVGPGTVDEFVIEKQFFRSAFTEVARVSAEGGAEFTTQLENLPVGTHRFRITALRNGSTLARNTATTTLRSGEADVLVHPNPFVERARLSVTLPSGGQTERVRVTVFDVLGRKIGTPFDALQIDGSSSIQLNAKELGIRGSGMYFVRVEGNSFAETVQVARVR